MPAELDRVLRQQDGVLTRAQALHSGLTRHALTHRLTRRWWARLLPGVYLAHGGAPTDRQRCRAALLFAGPAAALGGATACQRYGLRRALHDPYVRVLSPHRCHVASTGFVRITRSVRMPSLRRIDGLPTVPVARAVVDACRELRAIDDVRGVVAEVVQCGRVGVAELIALPRPQWNVDVFVDGRWLARPDAYWADAATVLEIDSYAWHLSPADLERTQRRHARMTAAGLRVVHVSPNRLRAEPDAVVTEIAATLALGAGNLCDVRTSPGDG